MPLHESYLGKRKKPALRNPTNRYPAPPPSSTGAKLARLCEGTTRRKEKDIRSDSFMQKGAIITFPTFALLPESARKMRNAVERFFLAVSAALDSFAFAVPILPVLLIIVISRAFSVVVRLVRIPVAVILHGRSGLRLLDMSQDGAKVNIRGWLRWLIVGCPALADRRHCRVVVKTSGGRL